jgi:hypothetical protein
MQSKRQPFVGALVGSWRLKPRQPLVGVSLAMFTLMETQILENNRERNFEKITKIRSGKPGQA